MRENNHEEEYFKQVKVHQKQIDEINNSFNNLMTSIEDLINNDQKGPNGEEITEDEWDIIKYKSYGLVTLLKNTIGIDFPLWECIRLIGTVIGFMIGPFYFLRQPIFSVGFGFSFIPWYFYESFFGRLLRPIWLTYIAGFTSTYHINPYPPRIPYIRLGLHRLRTVLYNGLYINFGELQHDRPLGIIMLIGYGFTGMA
jgi:hypothetical protein